MAIRIQGGLCHGLEFETAHHRPEAEIAFLRAVSMFVTISILPWLSEA